LLLVLSLVAQRIVDEDIRVRWFRATTGAALTRLVGGAVPVAAAAGEDDGDLNDQESTLLHLLVEGHTNAEMAAALGTTEEVVGQQLAGLFAKIGAGSRADAKTVALTGNLV